MTVSAGFFTNNSEVFCRMTLPKTMLWADRIIVLDLGSVDGTEAYCKSILRPQDTYIRRSYNTIPTLGFDEAFNVLINESECDWAYVSGINVCVNWHQRNDLKEILRTSTAPILSMPTYHVVEPPPNIDWVKDMDTIVWGTPVVGEHRNFIKTNSKIQFRGYIHEEPYLGDKNADQFAQKCNVIRFHFGGWLNNNKKLLRHHYMIYRAKYEKPELQQYIHPHWFTKGFYPYEDLIKKNYEEYKWMYPHELKP